MIKQPRLMVCSEAEADLYAFRRGRESDLLVRIIRGRRCAVMDRCMAEWGAAMQLPYCFEGTWDSLGQCLQELAWPAGKVLIILITNAERVLPRASGEFAKMLEVLDAYGKCEETHRPSGLEVVLHAEERSAEMLTKRLASAGIAIRPIGE